MALSVIATPQAAFAETLNNQEVPVIQEQVDSETLSDLEVFSSIDEALALGGDAMPDEFIVAQTNNKQKSPTTYETWTRVSSSRLYNNIFLNYHPQHTTFRRASGYYFSTSSNVSVGASIGGSYVSVSISAAASSTGYYVNANYNKWSRPAVYADINKVKYTVKTYNTAGKLLKTETRYQNVGVNQYIKILYK